MNFSLIDWVIVGAMLSGLVVMALISSRHTKSVADYLAAGRSAGRYMMTMASGMVWIGAINVVAMFELYYEAGFTAMWWVMLTTPFAMYLAITGLGIYRFRETRALTVAQYLEQRYSRNVRVVAGILAWVAGLINFGIFPAIGARFFIALCGFPEFVTLFGGQVATFSLTMFVLLGISLFFVFAGGHVVVLVTDCLQGMFSQVVATIIVVVLMVTVFDWSKILEVLMQAPAGESMLDPLKTNKLPDFNVWYFLISIVGMFYACLSHMQAQAYNASAKTAHEARMGGVLNQWRWLALCLFFMVLTLCAILVLKHPDYAEMAARINAQLDTISMDPANATRKQLTVTMALSHILPTGLVGLFAAVMVAALISTYDSFMHTWGTVFLQDIVMPFRKKRFESRTHLWLLRLSILGVGVFAFFYSLFFENQESILMYFALVNNIWLGGAGAVLLGGLYWKRGTTHAAMASLVLGALMGTAGVVCNQLWPRLAGSPFPLNPQWIWFINILVCTAAYVALSLLEQESFNLKKLLHRGEYAVETDQTHVDRSVKWHHRLFGIDNEFKLVDRLTAYMIVGWFLVFLVVFLVGTLLALTGNISQGNWASFWRVYLWLLFALSIGATTWLTWGGIRDMASLFRSLKSSARDLDDDGTVKHEHGDDQAE